MDKEKQRQVEVSVDGKKIKIIVKKPAGAVQNRATRHAAKVWSECLTDGIMTKKELRQFMKTRNIWNEDKDEEEKNISREIAELEKELAFGKNGSKRVRAVEGKETAIKIREKRIELRDLIVYSDFSSSNNLFFDWVSIFTEEHVLRIMVKDFTGLVILNLPIGIVIELCPIFDRSSLICLLLTGK